MHRRTGVVLVGTLLAALVVPMLTTAARAGTGVSADGIVTITVPDIQALPHSGFANYPYTVTIATLPPGTAWNLTLTMSKAGGGSKVPILLPGTGSGSVPNLFRTMHLKSDPMNGAGRYTLTASLKQTVGGTVSTASTTTTFLAPSAVAITRLPGAVHVGKQYYFTGQVFYFRPAINAYTPIGVATLTLFWRPAGSTTWTPAGTARTNSIGQFEVVKYGAVSGSWSVLYPGTASVAASSHTVVVTVI